MIIYEDLIISILRSLVVFLSILCCMRLIELIFLGRIIRCAVQSYTNLFCFIVRVFKSSWLFLSIFLALCISFYIFPMNQIIWEKFRSIFLVIFIFYITWLIHRLISCRTESLIADRKENRRNITSLKFFNRVFDIVLWVGAILIVISILNYDVRVLLAGLGVGGVLFAIASQKILSELFTSFMIYSDHIFAEGDFIVIGDNHGAPGEAQGRIERIGVRSTQLRGPNGENIILPNQDLANKIIYNYSKKNSTRMSLAFSVDYTVPSEVLNKMDDLIKEILDNQDFVKCGQIDFKFFGVHGPVFELTYDLETSEYHEMQTIYKQIALALKDKLSQNGINILGR